MEQAYNPLKRKQVIVMKNITITTYKYRVQIKQKGNTLKVVHTSLRHLCPHQ